MRSIIYIIIVGFVLGCNGNHLKVPSPVVEELKIQCKRFHDDRNSNGSVSYRIRVFPSKLMIGDISDEVKQNFWYKMDSCFYIIAGSRKYHAFAVEPIANGQKNMFEYLLQFDALPDTLSNESALVFNDKYLTHKIHYLQLNAQ